ncbi:hypothetical protein OsJ_20975 [Oryza sativa Japonica Group]|uniref:Uncharacterized protein n=1 Tax=Oryza sativa subsp. japonica TaxID=39947 RepID=B9FSR5_ORYSJ|nr:hypothetical protein OsJ_20975 [Oryza sativa Japonica Group]
MDPASPTTAAASRFKIRPPRPPAPPPRPRPPPPASSRSPPPPASSPPSPQDRRRGRFADRRCHAAASQILKTNVKPAPTGLLSSQWMQWMNFA